MRKKINRILIIIGIVWAWIFLLLGIYLAEAKDPDYPTKPINFFIPWPAGGSADLTVRQLNEAASKHLGQPIININKVGGAGVVATIEVMKAKPDGYTLGFFSSSSVLIAPLSGEVPYKDLSGFTLIMNYGKFNYPMIVRGDAPWKTWKELIDWARENPKKVKFGILGGKAVSPQGIVLSMVEKKEQVDFTYMTIKGSADSLVAVLAGHVDVAVVGPPAATTDFLEQGKIRFLGYMDREKIPGYENFPSLYELYGFEACNYMGIWGPKGIPNFVLKRLDDAYAKAVRDPDLGKVMKRTFANIAYIDRHKLDKELEVLFKEVGETLREIKAKEEEEMKGKK